MDGVGPMRVDHLIELAEQANEKSGVMLKLYDVADNEYIEVPLEFARIENGELHLFGILWERGKN